MRQSPTVLGGKLRTAAQPLWDTTTGSGPPSVIAIPDDQLQGALDEVRSLSEKISAQTIAILPFQILLATAFGAAEAKGGVSGWTAELALLFLGFSIAMSALGLSRVHAQTLAGLAQSERETFVHAEARSG